MDKQETNCPNCNTTYTISTSNEGKKAKCAKCNHSFIVTFPKEEQPAFAFDPLDIPPTQTQTTWSNTTERPSKPPIPKYEPESESKIKAMLQKIPIWAQITALIAITLTLGYFMGREHLKYQIRSNLSTAVNKLTQNLQSNFAPQTEEAQQPIQQLNIGETAQLEGFSLQLVKATIKKPEVYNLAGELGYGNDPQLNLIFIIQNTDERKIINYTRENMFAAPKFRLRDDVDNSLRSVNYGVGSRPKGALYNEDIQPGEKTSHVVIFNKPPPKTQYLVLTVDLDFIGGKGQVEYKIPAQNIENL